MEQNRKDKFGIEELAIFCKKKGFVYKTSEIYGGIAGFYDFGPLGVELKNNVKRLLWKRFVQDREDIVGIDGAIISHPKVWQASGHVESFADLMLECSNSKCGFKTRADAFIEEKLGTSVEGLPADEIQGIVKDNSLKCPLCNSDFEEVSA
ncbi:glycine--tRNA ligase, partial [Candidatus Woesearchaeota archaeon]